MTQPDRDPPRPVSLRDLLLLAVGASVLFLGGLGARDLWNPNEPLYGLAVVEMEQRDDWVVPTVNRQVFAEKPILYFWAARASASALGGVSELALRLPSALCGIGSVLLLYVLVCPYAGRRRARIAAALLATTYLVWWISRSAQMEGMVLLSTLAAVLAVTRVIDFGAPALRGWSLAGLAVGLGFLAKGPVAIVLPGLVYLGYVLATGRPRLVLQRGMIAGAGVALAVAAPWFVILWLRGEVAFLHEALVRQSFVRYVAAWDHRHGLAYYAVHFWSDALPWGLFVPLAFALPARSGIERRLDRMAWMWLALVIAFFSLSDSKRSLYLLPALPAASILAAGVVESFLAGRLESWRRRLFLCVAGVLVAIQAAVGGLILAGVHGAGPVAGRLAGYPELEAPGTVLAALLLVAAGALLAAMWLRPRGGASVPVTILAGWATVYLMAGGWVLPAADVMKSPRPVSEELVARAAAGAEIRSYGLWWLRSGYTYYAGMPIANLETEEQLRAFWDASDRAVVLVEDGSLDAARAVLDEQRPVYHRPVGSHDVYLFAKEGPTGRVLACQGNEPFWNLMLRPHEALYESISDASGERVFRGSYRRASDVGVEAFEWRGFEPGGAGARLVAHVTEERCRDTMAGDTSPFTHAVRLLAPGGGEVFGCCREIDVSELPGPYHRR